MALDELADYRYRGARALVLLHDRALRDFLPAWRTAVDRAVVLPATQDPDYISLPALLCHVFRASRGYMTWLCEKLALADPRIEEAPGSDVVSQRAHGYLEHVLQRWRLPLAGVEEERFREIYVSRWGEALSCEAMLEHAVVHPARHRLQLEELLEAQGEKGR